MVVFSKKFLFGVGFLCFFPGKFFFLSENKMWLMPVEKHFRIVGKAVSPCWHAGKTGCG